MAKNNDDFPEEYLDEPEKPFDESDYDPKRLGNTVELSNKSFSQKMVQEMNQNQLKISKLKLKNLIKEKKQIKQYLKKNKTTTTKTTQSPNTSTITRGSE